MTSPPPPPPRRSQNPNPLPNRPNRPPSFPFFSLPRELRDAIYLHLQASHPTPTVPPELAKNADGHPHPDILDAGCSLRHMPRQQYYLVSRQFGTEYLSAVRPRSTLAIYHGWNTSRDWRRYAKRVGAIEVFADLRCEATPEGNDSWHPELSRHPEAGRIEDAEREEGYTCGAVRGAGEWVVALIEMGRYLPVHEEVRVNVGLWWASDQEMEWPGHVHAAGLMWHLDAMTMALERVERVSVTLFDCGEDYEEWVRGEREMPCWAEWTRGEGWRAGEARGRRKVDERGGERRLGVVRGRERAGMLS